MPDPNEREKYLNEVKDATPVVQITGAVTPSGASTAYGRFRSDFAKACPSHRLTMLGVIAGYVERIAKLEAAEVASTPEDEQEIYEAFQRLRQSAADPGGPGIEYTAEDWLGGGDGQAPGKSE